MAQRTDQRKPTRIDLECYQKCIKLTNHTLSVCKVKEKQTNNKHIVKRQLKLGQMLIDSVVEMGANIIQANEMFVGANLNINERIVNFQTRLRLQHEAISLSYRMEHIIRVLNDDRPFADSTLTYWVMLLVETRNLLVEWKDSDKSRLSELL